jgi:glycosyltransferase involved in cell wall biosynthesis
LSEIPDKLTILMFCTGLGERPLPGGIQTYTRGLAHELAHRGHEVHVLTDGAAERDYEATGLWTHEMPLRWFPILERWMPGLGQSWHIALKVRRLQQRHGFDVVEFPNWEAPGLVETVMKHLATVTRLHTAFAETMAIDGLPLTPAHRFLMWTERMAVRRSTAVVTHTQAHRGLMAESLGIDEGRIRVIPHGVTIPARPMPMQRQNDKLLKVLYVGRMEHRKGTVDLLRAIPEVLKEVSGVQFTLAGADRPHAPGSRLFQDYFRQDYPLDIQKHVRFAGQPDENVLTELYQDCDLFVGPSLYESFGLIFVEAMRWGKPVVACRTGGIPEVVKDGECGLLANPSDPVGLAAAIIRLLKDHELRVRMGTQAYAWTKSRFSINKLAERTEDMYRETAERFRASHGKGLS